MKPLIELIANAQNLIGEISHHPDYQKLVKEGYQPDLTLGDAYQVMVDLMWEIAPPSTPMSEIFGVEPLAASVEIELPKGTQS